MAKKNKKYARGVRSMRYYAPALPETADMHADVKPISRRKSRAVYTTMEKKRDMVNARNYDRVENPFSCFYAGLDPRRRVEAADGGMVQEDPGAIANLPRKGFQREYPRSGFNSNPFIQDSYQGEE